MSQFRVSQSKKLNSGTGEHNNVSLKHMQKMGVVLFLYLSLEDELACKW